MPAVRIEIAKTLEILEGFDGLPSLKKLQAHLNLDPENAPISRRTWKEANRELLTADPVITASMGGAQGLFGLEQSFKVIYCRLKTEELRLTDERAVVAELLPHYPYALFVFSDARQKRFHFLNVKDEPQGQKRRLFRRITVGNGERLRTAAEQLGKLDGEELHNLPLSQIQQRFDEAFDVGPVTKKFFAEYKRIFEMVKESIKGFKADEAGEEARNLFTQRLFNRLMFIAFIQKKGWLKYQGDSDYLKALWKAHHQDKFANKGTFYAGRLQPLFFLGLNTGPSELNLIGINRGGQLGNLIGDVPYLNGGLFEKDADDENARVSVPDAGLNEVINGIFEQFNFTITESTPLDIEVAVDPEMLGKIFEELVTGRHDTGSYYTPKPIVSFMCREAIKGYLESEVRGEAKGAVERFVDKHEPDDIHNAEAVLNALRRVTVCDPACGSGAYLLGMMHELLDLRQCLFQSRQLDNKSTYQRKLDIIQTNIYGVDIADFAVNIARLRLWLSLAVDFNGSAPEPLPNLDYKIEVGDSICSPSPGSLQMGLQQPLVDQFLELKKRYLVAHNTDKQALRSQVDSLRRSIMGFSNRGEGGFDWIIDFAEVFADGGFDVVMANPPYVRHEKIKHLKPDLKMRFPKEYSGTADLYCYFYLRAWEMLRTNGMISFISSNKWLRADYGGALRGKFAAVATVRSVTDFGELPVFETAATFPMIFVAQKSEPLSTDSFMFTPVKNLDAPYPDIASIIGTGGHLLPREAISGREWRLVGADKALLMKRMEQAGVPLAAYVDNNIYYGIKTGLNEAFVIDSATRKRLIATDPKSKEITHPTAKGDDVRRWRIEAKGQWLIVTKIGVEIKRYPAVFAHLKQWKTKLEKRTDQGDHWWELRPCKYYDLFDGPKIVFPDLAMESRFAFSPTPMYFPNTTYLIPTDDFYLLGVLNSTAVWSYVKERMSVMGDSDDGGRLRFFTQFVKDIPIPNATPKEKSAISKLVKECVDREGKDCAKIEETINARVLALYGLKD